MPLKFYLDKRKNKYGEAPIRIVWSFSGDRYQTTIGYSIPPQAWDAQECRVTPAAYNHKKTASTAINSFLDAMETAVNRLENFARIKNAALTKPLVKQVVTDVLASGGAYPTNKECIWKTALCKRSLNKTRYFQHFRGREYKLIYFGKDSETMEDVVVYQALYGIGKIWVCPYDIFFGKVTDENGNEVERFKELSKNR